MTPCRAKATEPMLLTIIRPWAWLALWLCGALAACSTTPPAPQPVPRGDFSDVTRQLQAYIAHEMQAHKVTGLSIALVDDQRVLWAQGMGWADVQAKVPAGADTLYRMGSVSKLLTDTAAMQLVARGRLALDAPIQQAVPDFRIRSRWGDAPITPRLLMTHHSGLPRDQLAGMWGTPVGDFRAMLRGLGDAQAAQPPGLAFAYSNVGLDLLGQAIENLAGLPFEAQMQRSVLAPLGMGSASFSAAVPKGPQMARAYFKGELQQEPGLRDVPAGGLNASVADMARFIAMQFAKGRNAQGQVVLPEAQWAEMLRPQNADVALDVGFHIGLGWMLATLGDDTVHGGGPVAHHAGATYYYRSQLMLLPEQRLGVVVAANDGVATAVVNRVAQRALALLLEAKTGVKQPPRVPGWVPATKPWSQAALQACVGDYITLAGPLQVRLEGSVLRARLDDQTLELVPGEEGRLGLRYKLAGLIPLSLGTLSQMGLQCRIIDGRQVLVARLDGQEMLAGDRIAPANGPLPAALAGLAGRYVPQLQAGERPTLEAVTVLAEGGRLWVQPQLTAAFGNSGSTRLPLQVLNDREAMLLGPLGDAGPVIARRAGADGRDELVFSGWIFQKPSP